MPTFHCPGHPSARGYGAAIARPARNFPFPIVFGKPAFSSVENANSQIGSARAKKSVFPLCEPQAAAKLGGVTGVQRTPEWPAAAIHQGDPVVKAVTQRCDKQATGPRFTIVDHLGAVGGASSTTSPSIIVCRGGMAEQNRLAATRRTMLRGPIGSDDT